MADNRVVVYKGPGEVAVEDIDYPKLELPDDVVNGLGIKKAAPHAVDPEAGHHEHLRQRPAHGAGPYDGTGRPDAGSRDHR